jgi:hypothetical protein
MRAHCICFDFCVRVAELDLSRLIREALASALLICCILAWCYLASSSLYEQASLFLPTFFLNTLKTPCTNTFWSL